MILDPKVGDRIIRRIQTGTWAAPIADNECATIVELYHSFMRIQWDRQSPRFSTEWSSSNCNFFRIGEETQLNERQRREEHAMQYL